MITSLTAKKQGSVFTSPIIDQTSIITFNKKTDFDINVNHKQLLCVLEMCKILQICPT